MECNTVGISPARNVGKFTTCAIVLRAFRKFVLDILWTFPPLPFACNK